MRWSTLTLIVFMLCSSLLVCGCNESNEDVPTGVLRGSVTDPVSERGLPGVPMILVNGDYKANTAIGADNSTAILASTTTDANGRFTFGPIGPGKYGISPASAAFNFASTQNTADGLFLLNNGEEKQIDFSVVPSAANVGPSATPVSPRRLHYQIDTVMTNADFLAIQGGPYPILNIYRRCWFLFVPAYIRVAQPAAIKTQVPPGSRHATIEFASIQADSEWTALFYTEDDIYRFEYVDANQAFTYDMALQTVSGGNPSGQFKATLSMDPIKITMERVK